MASHRKNGTKSVTKQAKPLLEAFFEWLHTLEDSVDRSSLIGEAVLYTLNQEIYLKRYLEDGHLSIDNLAAERSLKKLCDREDGTGLFAKSIRGAQTSATVYSMTETAMLERAETLQLPHLCDGKDERFRPHSQKRKPCWNCFPGPPACQLTAIVN